MSWHIHPDVVLWSVLLQGGYLYAVRAVGGRAGRQATRAQLTWFTAGVAVLYVGAGTPIHDLAEHRLFLVHMIQHMLFTLVAPPLLLLGTPGWLLEPLLRRSGVLRVARVLTNPLVALLLFNAVTLFTHLPPAVDLTLRRHSVHFLVHALLTASAIVMWWPVLSPTSRLSRVGPVPQMCYLFIQSFVPTVLASFLTFAQTVLYEFYASVPRTWGLSARDDQLIAGLIMKLGGGAILWLAIGIVFFTWVAREDRRPAAEPLRWEDVEQELDQMGLTQSGTNKV